MADDSSLLDSRMRGPAAIAVAAGVALGLLTGYTVDAGTPDGPSWALVAPFALLATVCLYLGAYRNLSKRVRNR
jgi:peptidoglycan/LPS O-acetylase OafA/YrhL